MPRYDYRCDNEACDTDTFEITKSYSDNAVTECPVCGTAANKLLSPIAVHFKGSGFYSTDNRGSSGASGGDPDKPDSKADSKTDSKSETKSESGSGSGSKKESKSDSKSKSTPGSSSKSSDSKSKSAASSSKS